MSRATRQRAAKQAEVIALEGGRPLAELPQTEKESEAVVAAKMMAARREREESCWREIQAALERHRCRLEPVIVLRATPQQQEAAINCIAL